MTKAVQMWEHKWYLDKFSHHECCDCGLTHKVEYSVEKGRLFTRWKVDKRATSKVRKDADIKVVRGSKRR